MECPNPKVIENVGGTTTVNNDAHVRVWVVQIPAEGTYDVQTDGQVNGYINPHARVRPWQFLWVAGVGVRRAVCLRPDGPCRLVVLVGEGRQDGLVRSAPEELLTLDGPTWNAGAAPSDPSYTPTDDGVRIEQLKSLAALRDSGALTEDEFEAEKRRVLES